MCFDLTFYLFGLARVFVSVSPSLLSSSFNSQIFLFFLPLFYYYLVIFYSFLRYNHHLATSSPAIPLLTF